MADLERASRDVAYFAEVVGFPLTEVQREAGRLEKRITAICAPRQSGKSRLAAVVAVWWCYRRAGERVLIVSSGEDRGREVIGVIREICRHPILSGSVVDEQALTVKVANGGVIEAASAAETSIRGRSGVSLLIFDEHQLHGEGIVTAALPTIAAVEHARVLMLGSASVSDGSFYDHVTRPSEHVASFRWTLADAPWITPSMVEMMRGSMSELRFRAEMEGVFAGTGDSLFPRSVVERCTVDYVPDELASCRGPARVFAGLDLGLTTDHCALICVGRPPVLTELGRPVFAVRVARRWESGAPLTGVFREICDSPAAYDRFCGDGTSMGGGVLDAALWPMLRNRAYHRGGAPPRPTTFVVNEFEPPEVSRRRARALYRPEGVFCTVKRSVTFSARMKSAVFTATRLLCDDGQLIWSNAHTDLIREALLLRIELTSSGNERIAAPGGQHDDLMMALILSLGPFFVRATKDWRTVVGELARQEGPFAQPPQGVEMVQGPGYMVPRRPTWLSVHGPGVTVPGDDETQQLEERGSGWTMIASPQR